MMPAERPINLASYNQPNAYSNSPMMYQALNGGGASTSTRTMHYPHHGNYSNHHPAHLSGLPGHSQTHSSSSNSSTPPSLSTSSTTNSNQYATNSTSNGSSTLNPGLMLHHYDRPDALRHSSQAYFQRVKNGSFAAGHAIASGDACSKDNANNNTSATMFTQRGQLYRPSKETLLPGSPCEYAVLKFDHPPSPPSQC